MHAAALWPAPNVMQKLLDHGGKIDAQDELGNTPLHVAARANYHREVVRFLLRRTRCRPAGALGVHEIVDSYRYAGPTGLRTTRTVAPLHSAPSCIAMPAPSGRILDSGGSHDRTLSA
jgi:ankyrin repeat protein